jgi:hypothetical protein
VGIVLLTLLTRARKQVMKRIITIGTALVLILPAIAADGKIANGVPEIDFFYLEAPASAAGGARQRSFE